MYSHATIWIATVPIGKIHFLSKYRLYLNTLGLKEFHHFLNADYLLRNNVGYQAAFHKGPKWN